MTSSASESASSTGNTNTAAASRTIKIRIRRQDAPGKPARWEEFAVPVRPNMNIISCLQWIAAHPTTTDGKATTTPVYDSGCLEEVCGACTMVINGKVRQACSALVDKIIEDRDAITLEPMSKFPVIRDLFVDRSRLFNDLKRIKAWVPIDGTYDIGPGPSMPQEVQETRYPLRAASVAAAASKLARNTRRSTNSSALRLSVRRGSSTITPPAPRSRTSGSTR